MDVACDVLNWRVLLCVACLEQMECRPKLWLCGGSNQHTSFYCSFDGVKLSPSKANLSLKQKFMMQPEALSCFAQAAVTCVTQR